MRFGLDWYPRPVRSHSNRPISFLSSCNQSKRGTHLKTLSVPRTKLNGPRCRRHRAGRGNRLTGPLGRQLSTISMTLALANNPLPNSKCRWSPHGARICCAAPACPRAAARPRGAHPTEAHSRGWSPLARCSAFPQQFEGELSDKRSSDRSRRQRGVQECDATPLPR
jgi:hypothetical protein